MRSNLTISATTFKHLAASPYKSARARRLQFLLEGSG
jgi:hypothetical protein